MDIKHIEQSVPAEWVDAVSLSFFATFPKLRSCLCVVTLGNIR